MKRALPLLLVLLVASLVVAGARPIGAVTVTGSGTVVSVIALTKGSTAAMQCPSHAQWYRTINADELADGGSGLVFPGAGMTDGGAFGVFADFSLNSDPLVISLTSNQQNTEVGVALLGNDAGGSWPCFFVQP